MANRYLVAGVTLLAFLSLAFPANARWGTGYVNTWVVREGATVGRFDRADDPTPVAPVVVANGDTASMFWVIRNLGGQPSWHRVGFHGCRFGDGFHLRYLDGAGHDVTWKVTHDGYGSRVLDKGEQATLRIEITAVAVSTRTCLLEGTGLSGHDEVKLLLLGVA